MNGRPRWSRPDGIDRDLYRLCHRTVGEWWSTCLEPLRNQWTTDKKNIEAWHGKLKRMALHAHPNIFIVIKLFKDIQNSKEILQNDTETSRRNYSSTDKEVREHQEANADPEWAIPRRDHRPYDLRRFSIGTSSFRTLT